MSEPEMVWMDRIIYFEDGRTETPRQWVPSTYCKHDDGECHADDPCANCPIHRAAVTVGTPHE